MATKRRKRNATTSATMTPTVSPTRRGDDRRCEIWKSSSQTGGAGDGMVRRRRVQQRQQVLPQADAHFRQARLLSEQLAELRAGTARAAAHAADAAAAAAAAAVAALVSVALATASVQTQLCVGVQGSNGFGCRTSSCSHADSPGGNCKWVQGCSTCGSAGTHFYPVQGQREWRQKNVPRMLRFMRRRRRL